MRIYSVGRNAILAEEDPKGDGQVTMTVYGKTDNPGDFEVFRKSKDGLVQPITSRELFQLRRELQESSKFFEGFAHWLAEKIETESPEKIANDVKALGEAAKRAKEAMDKEKQEKDK